jgi:hypothetical protein
MIDTAQLTVEPLPGGTEAGYMYEVRCRHGYICALWLDDGNHNHPEGQRYALYKLRMKWETATFCCPFPEPEGYPRNA